MYKHTCSESKSRRIQSECVCTVTNADARQVSAVMDWEEKEQEKIKGEMRYMRR